MKSRQWIAAVIAVSGIATMGLAVADASSRFDAPVASSSKTRAEVLTELNQARADGLLKTHGDRDDLSILELTRTGAAGVAGSRFSGRTRAEVRAEAIEHMKTYNPGLDQMYGR